MFAPGAPAAERVYARGENQVFKQHTSYARSQTTVQTLSCAYIHLQNGMVNIKQSRTQRKRNDIGSWGETRENTIATYFILSNKRAVNEHTMRLYRLAAHMHAAPLTAQHGACKIGHRRMRCLRRAASTRRSLNCKRTRRRIKSGVCVHSWNGFDVYCENEKCMQM
jgi:hypothetical protein